jgi:thiosulfate/3-mercaptopyruvate sulfurtransferase
MARWNRLGLPVEDGPQSVATTTFEPDVRPELLLHTEEIEASLPDVATLQLVDAREAGRFRGELEPIDPIAGHIPGARNVPFAASLEDDATWKSAGALRAMWQTALGDGLGAPWSVMCGSGVTACHLVISALQADLPEPRVYVGSWSEWIQDPARPIGKGAPKDAEFSPKHAEGA